MKSRLILLLSLLMVGCSADRAGDGPDEESFASAIRAVGFSCTRVVNSNDLRESEENWRVSCDGALTYTARLSEDSGICITPIPSGGFPGPAAAAEPTIDEQCVSVHNM
jgi:hypothetical protein